MIQETQKNITFGPNGAGLSHEFYFGGRLDRSQPMNSLSNGLHIQTSWPLVVGMLRKNQKFEKLPDKSTTSYAILDFEINIENL